MLLEYVEVIEQALCFSSNQEKSSLAPKVQKQIQQVDSMLNYYYLVWKAWEACERGDVSGMVENLQLSWKCTPLLTTETILSWIASFAVFSSQKGVKLDTYSLIHSEAWQQLIESIQGIEVALSVR